MNERLAGRAPRWRTIIATMLAATLVAAQLASGRPLGGEARAATSVEAGEELVNAAFSVLMDRFVRPVESRGLLTAAWKGARAKAAEGRLGSFLAEGPTLTGDRVSDLAEFQRAFRALLEGAGSSADAGEVAMAAAEAMTESVGEQHTTFLTPDQFEQFRQSLATDRGVVGIGVQLAGDRGPFAIQSVFPGTPAAAGGLLEGDVIERVDGRDVAGRDLRGLSQLLRGDEGKPVVIDLRRAGQPLQVTLVRARYVVPPLVTRVLPEKVCHLALSQFPFAFAVGPSGKAIGEDLDAALEGCEAGGAQGWILDLRGNGGGSSLAQVAGRFMDGVPLLVETDKIGGRYEQAADGHLFRVQRPLVVLVDGGSASASEALASAVQEFGRGTIVGQRTAGVLNTASIVALPLGAGMEVAIREVKSGRREIVIDGVGVTPDIAVAGLDRSAVPREAIVAALNPSASVGPLSVAAGPAANVYDRQAIRAMVEPLQLTESDAERPEDASVAGEMFVDTLSFYSGDSPNLAQGAARGARLDWRGGMVRWLGRGFPPPYALDVEIYGSADGAHRDLREVYEPGEPRNPPQSTDVEPSERFGDDTRYQVGTGQNEGRIWIAWRRGGMAFVVSYNVPPGQAKSFDGLIRLARIVNARAAAAGY
ncbi:MAG: S41 family peptidase [Chloroflexota bacterium]